MAKHGHGHEHKALEQLSQIVGERPELALLTISALGVILCVLGTALIWEFKDK